MRDRLNRFLVQAAERRDMAFAVVFALVIGMMIVPLPTWLVDVLLALNMAAGLLLFIITTYLRSPLDLGTFPSIILVTTVFRLALTVATTRMILGEGHAGDIIEGFGKFIIGGKPVVGLVVFLIIALVNFMVITKGAERIAEVSARFTLDAMPGKQMSIDADVRNGDMTKEEAKAKRHILEKESQFFGAMDGAMKFVKGDATAGLIIIAINLIGGLIIGMVSRGMSFSEAGNLYTLLTVGDGLVAQIPAMLISVASGAVVTRVVNEDSRDLGGDIAKQVGKQPRSIAITAAMILPIGLLPGFPLLIFAGLSLALGAIAFVLFRAEAGAALAAREGAEAAARPSEAATPPPPPLPRAEGGETLEARAAPATLAAMEAAGLAARLTAGLEEAARATGVALPGIAFTPDPALEPGRLRLLVEDVPLGFERFEEGAHRADAPAAALDRLGVPHVAREREGREEAWVAEADAEAARGAGVALEPAAAVLAGALVAEARRHAGRAFGVTEAGQWLERLTPRLGRLVSDAQATVPLLGLVELVRRLLDEEVPLTQPRLLLEALVREGGGASTDDLVALARRALRRQLVHALRGERDALAVASLSPAAEDLLRRQRQGAAGLADLRADQDAVVRLVEGARALLAADPRPVLVTAPDVRLTLWRLLASRGLPLPVLAATELPPETPLRSLGVLDDAAAAAAA